MNTRTTIPAPDEPPAKPAPVWLLFPSGQVQQVSRFAYDNRSQDPNVEDWMTGAVLAPDHLALLAAAGQLPTGE